MSVGNETDQAKPERRREWNTAVVNLAPRAEKLKNPQEVFAETIFFEGFKSDRNSIVIGRRGTGKTQLLMMIEWECIEKFEELRKIPIYINGSQLRNEAQLIGDSPNSMALSLYVELVKTITAKLNEFINDRIEKSFWDNFVKSKNVATEQRLKSTAAQLYELLETGEVRYLPSGDASHEIQTLDKASGKIEAGIGINVTDPKSLGWKLSLDAEASKELERTGISIRNIQGSTILPMTAISAKIGELLDLIDGSSLVLLFDEWSDVAPRIEVQPVLADMMKRTFSPMSSITLKLACIPNRTMLATRVPPDNPIPIGFEIRDDIFKDVDLDRIVFTENDIKQILPFFMILLQKHMSPRLSWVKAMSTEDFEDYVFTEIFANEDVLSELCQASAANPRDFITLFTGATTKQAASGSKNIELVHIRDAASALYDDKKEAFKAGSKEMRFLQSTFQTNFAEKGSYYFLIPEEDVDLPLIKNLWVERLIHKTPFDYYDSEYYVKYPRYQIDYSKCVDLLKAEAGKKGEEKGRRWASFVQDVTPETWLGNLIRDIASEGLPKLAAWAEKREAVINKQAGKIDIDIRTLIVDPRKFSED